MKFLLNLIIKRQNLYCLISMFQANETKIRENQRKARETEEKLSELAHMTFSDMLTENCSAVLDARHHILVDRWKGMTKDQLAHIRQQQLFQINERQVYTFPSVYLEFSFYSHIF